MKTALRLLFPVVFLFGLARVAGEEKAGSATPAMVANSLTVKPDVTVSLDGTGQFKSVNEAIGAAPMRTGKDDPRWVILVKAGTYKVRVDFYQNCSATIPVQYEVEVRAGGSARYYCGSFTPGSSDTGSAGSGRNVTQFILK